MIRNIQLYNKVLKGISGLPRKFQTDILFRIILNAIKTYPSDNAEVNQEMLFSATDFINKLPQDVTETIDFKPGALTLDHIVSCFECPPEHQFRMPEFDNLTENHESYQDQISFYEAIIKGIDETQFPDIFNILDDLITNLTDLQKFSSEYIIHHNLK